MKPGNPQPTQPDAKITRHYDPVARRLGSFALMVSVLSVLVAAFAAYQSYISARSAIANVRPNVSIQATGSVRVRDTIEIPLSVTNHGRSRATLRSIRLIAWRDGLNQRHFDLFEASGPYIYPDQTQSFVLRVPRFIEVAGGRVDISRGRDADRRLAFELVYDGQDLGSFRDAVMIPVAWRD